VWRLLLDPSEVNHFDQAKDPRQCSRRGVRGIVYARGTPSHTDCCDKHRSDSLVRAL
jgi:hypothetical protein